VAENSARPLVSCSAWADHSGTVETPPSLCLPRGAHFVSEYISVAAMLALGAQGAVNDPRGRSEGRNRPAERTREAMDERLLGQLLGAYMRTSSTCILTTPVMVGLKASSWMQR
jgi:hypothetical protein